MSYDHVELRIYINGRLSDARFLGIRGTNFPVVYGMLFIRTVLTSHHVYSYCQQEVVFIVSLYADHIINICGFLIHTIFNNVAIILFIQTPEKLLG